MIKHITSIRINAKQSKHYILNPYLLLLTNLTFDLSGEIHCLHCFSKMFHYLLMN